MLRLLKTHTGLSESRRKALIHCGHSLTIDSTQTKCHTTIPFN